MTTMDDLLNSSSISMFPATVQVDWDELEPGYGNVADTTITSAEGIKQLGQQIGPNGMSVTHSFDDGLPDPVTATGGNEASGTFQMDLVGRPPAIADAASLHWNSLSTSGSGTGTTITTTMPTDPAFWDYVLVAITVNSDTLITETSMPADTFWPWKLLGDVSDGGYHTYVFGRKHYTLGSVAPVFTLDASSSYAWVIGSIDVGRTASQNIMVPITPGDVEVVGEVASVSTHNQTAVSIGNRGWNVGVFGGASTASPWTSSGNTIVGQVSGAGVSTALITSPLRQISGAYAMSANSNSATANVAMVHIAMEVRDRPQLDAVGYFSTFNTTSPTYGFERDTATVIAATNHVALDGTGVETNTVYTGQMAGITLTNRTATMTGVSRTRLALDSSYQLPTVYGWREGCTTDWLAGYLLAKGGQYIGIPPNQYTRLWYPMYGSSHPYADGSAGFCAVYEWNTARPGGYFKRAGIDTTGPFATAMFAQQTDSSVISVVCNSDRSWPNEVPGVAEPVGADLFSQQNSVGLLTFWIRADPWVANPTAVTSGLSDDKLLFNLSLYNQYLGPSLPGITIKFNTDGTFTVWLGTSATNLTGANLVADGNWHFFGMKWDYHAGKYRFLHNNWYWDLTGQASASDVLPASDQVMLDSGGYNLLTFGSHLPIADFQLQTGQPYSYNFDDIYPAPTPAVTYRPTRQPLAVVAAPTPVQGWSTLQSLAQSTLVHLRCDESDRAVFVPLDYFGETAQMTVTTLNVLDTDFNAGALNLIDDPSQTRNVVTVQYSETSVGTMRSTILEMNTSLAVPRGVTYVTFPLDTPTAETHGAAAWWQPAPEFQKLTDTQIAGTTPIQNENVMSVNTLPDGSGSVFTSTAFTARIYDWDSNNIVVKFTNTYSGTLYLANNGTQIPFLRALGYAISKADAYVTVRDAGSIGTRRERALTTQVNWITDRTTAQEFASTLVTLLARPRRQITVTVQGDPRRKPGDLCQLVDSTGMKADGTWRIYKVVHNINGAQYTQDVTLSQVGPIAVWDEGLWDESVWGV
jgi:hypothetical protein